MSEHQASNHETTAALSAPPSAREIVACWEDRALLFDLRAGTTVTIGRSDACDVHLPHASVSRRHARLELDERGMTILDLGSANGTKVDGTLVSGSTAVQLGSLVEVGSVRLLVRMKIPADARGDAPMTEVRRLVDKVAASAVSLVILGETGVGKEVLTEEIHARSRPGKPLVRINCAGLTATLLESELFGYERGAFTGAVAAKPGLIEAADGGTLFLDELGEMPESTQPKLLRVLESREVRRIGAVKPTSVDVRFVSATHRDPRALAALGKFREDLLFRLNGFTLRLPPLRERRSEILYLANGFLRAACQRAARPVPASTDGARAMLESYRWPGNVRELRNVMDRVALIAEGEKLLVEHLVFDAAPLSLASDPVAFAAPPSMRPPAPPPPSEPAGERERIVAELARAGGNQAVAAKALGITPRVLGYRMDKLGIPRPRRST